MEIKPQGADVRVVLMTLAGSRQPERIPALAGVAGQGTAHRRAS